MLTPSSITAQKLWADFRARGIHLSVQWVREGNGTKWPRIWMSGGGLHFPGDFEAIKRIKPELVALLKNRDDCTEGTPLDNCDYALTRGFAPPIALAPSSLLEEFHFPPPAPRRLPYGNKGRPRHSQSSLSALINSHLNR